MQCPQCKVPQDGYGHSCKACGYAGGNVRRAFLWISIPIALVVAYLAASMTYDAWQRTGSSRNPYSNVIENQNLLGRRAAFARLMHDAGQQCTTLTKSLFRGDIGGNAAWSISCRDSGDWQVLIARTGDTRIANCGPLAQAGTPCWTRF